MSPVGEATGKEGKVGKEEEVWWSREEEKAFENAVATVPPMAEEEGAAVAATEELWLEAIAARVPGKTLAQVKHHYDLLVEDVKAIEAGRVPIPKYLVNDSPSSPRTVEQAAKGHPGLSDHRAGNGGCDSGGQGKSASKSDQERRKGIPWTEEEHRLFLLGLDKYGKGDWRSISRNFVVSRTPTQVASHAQKYFIRLNSMNRDRRRSSIHDITNVNGGDVPAPQGPITGQANANSATAIGSSMNHPQLPAMPAIGIYGPPLGHPVPGHMVSAVGTR
ncbi:hypothetical protein HPP92_007903 [Vanilla planifolia]|uniref:Transcription factor MYBS1 n=1 Tax=Vanilla planifolia TaxID=51239 RepID=A0A835RMN9_VANPL|nr:hypothetical protein HPP92_007903 [Vanilla planifolia]